MSDNTQRYAYPDLLDPDYVFDALLGYGMFSEKLPPCFTSESFLEALNNGKMPIAKKKSHSYVDYRASRNTNVPRAISIPHPESYLWLCQCIKKNWDKINLHNGKADKFNYCHVRKIEGEKHIFEMNYQGTDKWSVEEKDIDLMLGCRFVVQADIAKCFPSIYSHSIPWALEGKEEGKGKRTNDCNNCPNCGENWSNGLDKVSRSIKDDETNGMLIGPHTSNILSEIILTAVDRSIQEKGWKKVVRHIDDFVFYAKDEREAKDFLFDLHNSLKEYELELNAKKTKVTAFADYLHSQWVSKLGQFIFPERDEIGFTSIRSFIMYAVRLARKEENSAIIYYAIKMVAKKTLSDRAKRLYVNLVLQLTMEMPYLVPLIEEHVLLPHCTFVEECLGKYLPLLLEISILNLSTDSIAYVFYFALKYGIDIDVSEEQEEKIANMFDCVSMLLAYKFLEANACEAPKIQEAIECINNGSSRTKDKFWLLLYETGKLNDNDFLQKMNKNDISFIKADYGRGEK
ncbi:MAG: RNA-directed DNA polymerase [Phycisphaerae bacterium]|jgi:hypothetical protein